MAFPVSTGNASTLAIVSILIYKTSIFTLLFTSICRATATKQTRRPTDDLIKVSASVCQNEEYTGKRHSTYRHANCHNEPDLAGTKMLVND